VLLIDASLDNGKHERYETQTGGDSWAISQGAADRPVKEKPPGWRVRADAATHSYIIEKSENNHWRKMASFLVHVATCKQ
jgi:hypothetical protein